MKIIIVSKNENSHVLNYLLNFSLKDYSNNDIFLISPKAESSSINIKNKINDDYFLNFKVIKNLFEKYHFSGRIGWYYQQFLKYKIVLKLEGEDFFIIDGDTVINPNLIKKDLLCFVGKQNYSQYYYFYKSLFPQHKLSNLSFITNQMYFKKTYLKSMLREIEKQYLDDWLKVFIKKIVSNKKASFSEYQTYAEYIINRKLFVNTKKIKIFRRMDIIENFINIEKALNKYDVLSYEYHHETSFFLKLRMYLYYIFKRNVG